MFSHGEDFFLGHFVFAMFRFFEGDVSFDNYFGLILVEVFLNVRGGVFLGIFFSPRMSLDFSRGNFDRERF